MSLWLASTSATRVKMLKAAGVAFEAEAPHVDEEALKAGLRATGLKPRDQADALAEAKAVSVSRRRDGFVIGADQILALGDEAFDKTANRAGAKARLLQLRGKEHVLHTGVVVATEGAPIWRHVDTTRLVMRAFSDDFLESYLDQLGKGAFASVGGYQLEGLGAQLFESVEGDFFSVLGLPLLPLLSFLRLHGQVAE
ncbi:MAG: Maf-like protein [Hyphomonadaceae bacterium]|nr:Maf-like protein [Hyphomonadaceae bacterium]